MGGPGSGRKRKLPAARCPEHPNGHIKAEGTRTTSAGKHRRYRCTPPIGKPHKFSVLIEPAADRTAATAAQVALWSPPPACPEHPDSKVVRNGTYGRKTPKPRQRYRCTPADGSKPHTFTPPLPRDHVCDGEEHCGHCEEIRGVHRGETAVARRHSWPTGIVVRGLERLASGASYADVSRWAIRATGTKRTRRTKDTDAATGDDINLSDTPETEESGQSGQRSGKGKKRRSASSEASRNAWHIAADWTEAFSPPIWQQVDTQLRNRADNERQRLDALIANGEPPNRPQVVLVDDIPVYGRDLDGGKARRDAGFFILAVAEVHWPDSGHDDPFTIPDGDARLRLLRAMPKSNTSAWRLVFDELGYHPDFVVADAGTGIAAAIDAHYEPARTRFIPSIWHLTRTIGTALNSVPGAHLYTPAGKQLIAPIEEHLRRVHRGGALSSITSWATWWDELIEILHTNRLPVEKVMLRRNTYEPAIAGVLDDIRQHPEIPISTGGLETLLAKHVYPILAMRRTGFANIERTNMLLDLVVARHHGVFDDHAPVIRLLRDDNTAHGGWTVPLRSISDPRPIGGTYSSLRDTTLLHSLAADRGLA